MVFSRLLPFCPSSSHRVPSLLSRYRRLPTLLRAGGDPHSRWGPAPPPPPDPPGALPGAALAAWGVGWGLGGGPVVGTVCFTNVFRISKVQL